MNDFTLLYVEDDILTQKIVKSVLQGYFKEIYVANDGVEGLALYKKEKPDIVLTDISMPNLNGLEMSKRIKEENPEQHIVLFSSYSDIDYFSKAINMKVDKYILKPLVRKQMFTILDEVIEDLKREKEEKDYKRDLEFASNHDLLTGLANRKHFFNLLKRLFVYSRQDEKNVAILSMDLNKFKPINDTYGHNAGDLILKSVAKYLQKSLRKSDIVSRFGGDEFVIAIGFLEEHKDILKFLKKMERVFLEPVIYEDVDGIKHSIVIEYSIGITFISASSRNFCIDTLLSQADKAMYRAKKLNTPYAFYDSRKESNFKQKARQTQEIKDALNRGEFLLHYQPIIELEKNRVVAFEALLRWNHPQKGLLTPNRFLSYILDNLDISNFLGKWIIEELFKQSQVWSLEGEEIVVSINISLKEFNSDEFIFMIGNLLTEYPEVKPSNIVFEVDESIAIKDAFSDYSQLQILQELGFKITLDDFGTGSSTLIMLNKFNIDSIKIDKSFLYDMLENSENEKIVKAAIKLAKIFGYKVSAMGVEQKNLLPTLFEFGCDEAQGYAICKPVPVSEVVLLTK